MKIHFNEPEKVKLLNLKPGDLFIFFDNDFTAFMVTDKRDITPNGKVCVIDLQCGELLEYPDYTSAIT